MLLYILCLLVLGLPAMIMELAVGRAAQASPIYIDVYKRQPLKRAKPCMTLWDPWARLPRSRV